MAGKPNAKIAMSRQGRGLRGRSDGRAGTGILPQSAVTACYFNNSYAHDEQGDNPGQQKRFHGVLYKLSSLLTP